MSATAPRTRRPFAFTLLELIVVIVILGVLALLAIPTFSAVMTRAENENALQTTAALVREATALAAFRGESTFTTADFDDAVADLPAAGVPGVVATNWDLLFGAEEYSTRFGEFHGGLSPSAATAGVAMRTQSGVCAFSRNYVGGVIELWLSSEDIGEDCNAATALDGGAGGPGPISSGPDAPGGPGDPGDPGDPGGPGDPVLLQPAPNLFDPADTTGATDDGWPNVGAVVILPQWNSLTVDVSGNDPGVGRSNYTINAIEWSGDAGATWLDPSEYASFPFGWHSSSPWTESTIDDIAPVVGDTSSWDQPIHVANRGGGTFYFENYTMAPDDGDARVKVRYSYDHSTGTGEGTFVAIVDETRPPSPWANDVSTRQVMWDTTGIYYGTDCMTPEPIIGGWNAAPTAEDPMPAGTTWSLNTPPASSGVTVTKNSPYSVTASDWSGSLTWTINVNTGEMCVSAFDPMVAGDMYNLFTTFQGLQAVALSPTGAWQMIHVSLGT